MNHVHAMLQCDSHDAFLRKICSHRRKPRTNLIRLISLVDDEWHWPRLSLIEGEDNYSYLLAMSRESILVGIDGHGMHCQLMGGSKHANRDFLR